MTRAQIVAMFGLTMTLDIKALIEIGTPDNYGNLIVTTREGAGLWRNWNLPATGGWSLVAPVPAPVAAG